MIFFKKILILLIVIAAMYLTYLVVNFLKSKINVHRNMGAFLLLLLLSFATVFIIILFLGFVFTEYRNFFFKH
jgi:predicted PurR-regulated permease PerM